MAVVDEAGDDARHKQGVNVGGDCAGDKRFLCLCLLKGLLRQIVHLVVTYALLSLCKRSVKNGLCNVNSSENELMKHEHGNEAGHRQTLDKPA